MNDGFRAKLPGLVDSPDAVFFTEGAQALVNQQGGPAATLEILSRIRDYDRFTDDEFDHHEKGTIEFGGEKLLWRIDNYAGIEADYRLVMTVLLGSEY